MRTSPRRGEPVPGMEDVTAAPIGGGRYLDQLQGRYGVEAASLCARSVPKVRPSLGSSDARDAGRWERTGEPWKTPDACGRDIQGTRYPKPEDHRQSNK